MSETGAFTLSAHGQTVELWPLLGARIAAWRTPGGWDGLAPIAADPPLEEALRAGGCYPLAPYCNRIDHGRFIWAGREVQLRPNPLTAPHSLHGVAWRSPFENVHVSADEAILGLEHAGGAAWPWAFRLEQSARLSPDGLELTLSVLNTDVVAQPVGLGFHPFFPGAGANLRFHAETWWRLRPDRLPIGPDPIPADKDFSRGRPAPRAGFDDLYGGFDGVAEIAWPASRRRLRIEADPALDNAMLFTPARGDAFAFEPVSHPIDALNRPDTPGIRVLAPGARWTVGMRLRAE